LLQRSALYRLRLRRDAHVLRGSLQWRGAAIAAATLMPMRRMAFGMALSFPGLGRAARLMILAGRIVLLAKLARSTLDYARGSPKVHSG
jgi:hypothetical protein